MILSDSQEITNSSTRYADPRFQRGEDPTPLLLPSIWTEGRKWSKYGRVAFSLFFPRATKGPRVSGSRDVKKGGNEVIVLPSGSKNRLLSRGA